MDSRPFSFYLGRWSKDKTKMCLNSHTKYIEALISCDTAVAKKKKSHVETLYGR